MLAEQRREEILKIVKDRKTISVPELCTLLNSSESTIRRDLVLLDRQNRLVRLHGGAALPEKQFVMKDELFADKYELMSEEKQMIGKAAAGLIRPNAFVYIDAGTTTERLVDCISEKNAVYVTNSIGHARKLLYKGLRVILPGGELKEKTEAMVGADTVDAIRKFHFTIGFWGVNGLNREIGYTTPEMNEAVVKKISMEQTAERYVLADRSKFSLVSPVTFGDFEDAVIITDSLPDQSYADCGNIRIAGG
ncbi:MAG: DeoR/GlpR transcriptional regulator [Lachnospiraceae bacterium]|nr:DeoR/GlpR transcriptional regulator [Lachnospiraceae bacterium]